VIPKDPVSQCDHPCYAKGAISLLNRKGLLLLFSVLQRPGGEYEPMHFAERKARSTRNLHAADRQSSLYHLCYLKFRQLLSDDGFEHALFCGCM